MKHGGQGSGVTRREKKLIGGRKDVGEKEAALGLPQGLLLGYLTWSPRATEKWGMLPEPLSAPRCMTCQ